MTEYEILVAFTEKLSEEEQKEAIKDLENLINKAKGTVARTESWGKRTLAFQVKKNTNAFFWLITAVGSGNLPKTVNDSLRIEDNVLRFIIEKKLVSKKPRKVQKQKTLVPEIMR